MGLLMTLTQAGVDVPRDLSVVGYDDSHLSHLMPIGLTTVRQDAVLMAEYAVRFVGGAAGGHGAGAAGGGAGSEADGTGHQRTAPGGRRRGKPVNALGAGVTAGRGGPRRPWAKGLVMDA
ncbi:hypothetical protein GCM10017744_093460 [Streptomyces antimycoticus]|uniref:Transcriptional regulator LacI/GalR-like sensor domain-containing protein n=1 Tax=Streptomyces antimycoticus TaxID=68175 RepID=A0A4D4JUX6_9ACTN|nr:hypothetical protein SANT12839_005560 [Streptomyces antimycoticus]